MDGWMDGQASSLDMVLPMLDAIVARRECKSMIRQHEGTEGEYSEKEIVPDAQGKRMLDLLVAHNRAWVVLVFVDP